MAQQVNPFTRRKKSILPPVTFGQEEQESLLDSIKNTSLSGLNFVGGYLDKQVGSRAIRGLLGGKPRELMSIIPGSDTFGLTNKADDVGGKKLLNWDDPNTWADDIAGFGVEALLDPTLLIGGPVVKGAGKAMKAAGLMSKAERVGKAAGMGKRMTALSHSPRMVLNAGKELPGGTYDKFVASVLKPKKGGKGLESAGLLTQADELNPARTEFDRFSQGAKSTGHDPFSILDDPIHESLASLKLPFMEPFAAIGKGKQALKTAGVLDAAGKVIGAPLEGYQSHIDQKAEDTFRKELRSSSPASITDEMLDTNLSMLRAYAEGYHGKTLGNFIRSKQIKASDALPGGGSTMYQSPKWTSKLAQLVEQKVKGPISRKDLDGMIANNQIKKDEIETADLDDLFDGRDKIDADELKQHLAFRLDPDRLIQVKERSNAIVDRLTKEAVDEYAKKWGSTPSGDDAIRGLARVKGVEEYRPRWGDYDAEQTVSGLGDPKTYREFVFQTKPLPGGKSYKTPHWGEEHVFAHARGSDYVLNGKKYFLADEIQSDLHQQARKYGYNNKQHQQKIDDARLRWSELVQKWNLDQDDSSIPSDIEDFIGDSHAIVAGRLERYAIRLRQEGLLHPDLAKELDEFSAYIRELPSQGAIPDAPFKGDAWKKLTVRHLMAKLADEGYAGLMIPTGDTQPFAKAGNEGLAEFYDKHLPKLLKEEIKKHGGKMETIGDLKPMSERTSKNEKIDWKFFDGDEHEYGAAGFRTDALGHWELTNAGSQNGSQLWVLEGGRAHGMRHEWLSPDDEMARFEAERMMREFDEKHGANTGAARATVLHFDDKAVESLKRPQTLWQNQHWKSKAVEVVNQKVKQKVTEDQLVNILKGAGVKDEEIRQSNISGLYADNEKTMSREDILSWFDVEDIDDRVDTVVLTRGNKDDSLKTRWGPRFEQERGIKTRTKYEGSDPGSYKEILFKDKNNTDYREPHWDKQGEGVFAHMRGEDVHIGGKKYFGLHEAQGTLAENARMKIVYGDAQEALDNLDDVAAWSVHSGDVTDSEVSGLFKELSELQQKAASGKPNENGDIPIPDETISGLYEKSKEVLGKITKIKKELESEVDAAYAKLGPDVYDAISEGSFAELENMLLGYDRAVGHMRSFHQGMASAMRRIDARNKLRAHAFASGDQWMQTSSRGLLKHLVENGYEGVLLPAGADVPTVQSSGRAKTLTKLYDEILPKVMEKEVRKYGGKLESIERERVFNNIEWRPKFHNRPKPYGRSHLTADIPSQGGRLEAIEDFKHWKLWHFDDDGKFINSVNFPKENGVSDEELLQKAAEQLSGKAKSAIDRAKKIDFTDEIKKAFSNRQYMWQGGSSAPKGATTFMPDESIVLSMFKSADASTLFHEFLHMASKFLTDSDRATFNKFLGHADATEWAKWSVADHEKLATGFEKFWLKGHAPEGALAKVWGKIQSWMKAIYDTLTKQGKLTDVSQEVDEVFKRLVRGRPEHLRGNLLEGMSPAVARAAKALDTAGNFARFNKASRGIAQLFDSKSMGMEPEWAQRMGNRLTEETATARQQALEPFNEAINKLRTEGLLNDPATTRSAFRQLEGYEPFSGPMGETNRKLVSAKQAVHNRGKLLGSAPRELQDNMMPRQWPRAADIDQRSADMELEGTPLLNKEDPARLDFLKGIDKGTETIEYELARNPLFVGQKIAEGGSALDTPKEIFETIRRNRKYRQFFPGLDMAGTDPEAHKLATQRVKKLSKWLHGLKPEIQQKGLFKHPYESGRDYTVRHAERYARANVLVENLSEQMKPFMTKPLGADEKGASVNQVLVALNLKRSFKKNKGVHDDSAVARLGELLGVPDPRKDIADQVASGAKTIEEGEADLQKWRNSIGKVRIPREMASQFTRVAKFYKAPKEANKLIKALDTYTNLFKTSVLTWPARYVRDFISGQTQNYFIGAFSAKRVADVHRFLKGQEIQADRLLELPVIRQMLDERKLSHSAKNANEMLRVHLSSMELFGERVAQGAQIGSPSTQRGVKAIAEAMPGVKPLSLKEAGKELTSRQGAKDWWNNLKLKKPSTYGIRGVGEATEHTMPIVRAGNTTGVYVDALNRLSGYMELLKKGDSPAVAKQKMMAAHVDYSNRALTTTERQIMTRAFPFYRFTRHAAEFTAKELFRNPSGRMAQVVRGGNRAQSRSEEGEIVPEHIARTLALPIPEGIPGLSGPEGNTRYLTGLGLMHEDSLGLFQPGSSAYHGAKGTLQSLVGRANPLIKAPLEIAFGKQAFSGRDLEDLDPNVGRIIGNVMGQDTPVQTPILMEHALANSPAARALSSARTASDTRPNATIKAMLNLGTGVRLTDMDKEKAKNLAHRKLLEEYLRGNPNVHRFEHLFSKDDSKLSDRERAIMELYRQFSRESAKAARRRDQGGR